MLLYELLFTIGNYSVSGQYYSLLHMARAYNMADEGTVCIKRSMFVDWYHTQRATKCITNFATSVH